MVVRFSLEVNSKKTNQPLADLDGDHWAPSPKPSILRVFYSGTDNAKGLDELYSLTETVYTYFQGRGASIEPQPDASERLALQSRRKSRKCSRYTVECRAVARQRRIPAQTLASHSRSPIC
jgi:hypothetical protein